MTLLKEGCATLRLPLDETALAAFELYYQELILWNERLNLTAITAYDEVQTKHYLDCLVSLPLIAEELGTRLPLTKPLRLLDVGTGAGFPGIPLKVIAPALDLTLMDGTQKKIAFLELNTLVEYLLPLVRPGGLTVIFKGSSAPQEFMEARRAIKVLGGEATRLAPVEVPFLSERRFVLLVRKVASTSAQYPRAQGLARKKPIV